LITSVLAKNFKGRPSFEFKIGAKTLIVGPNGLFKAAPNPNAARLFQSFERLGVKISGAIQGTGSIRRPARS